MMRALKNTGYSTVLMHFRGCSGKPNRLPRSYHSGDTADAAAWLKSLKNRYPNAPLFAIGYSLGGNMLLKLLGEQGSNSLLDVAVSVSAPLQLDVSAGRMERGFSRLYQYYLLRGLKAKLVKKYMSHPMESLLGTKVETIKKISNFHTFDDLYTAPIHGFVSADDYYRRSSAKQYLGNIGTPTLIVQALDDPFMTEEILPGSSELSKAITLEVYPHGGHVGFVSGTLWKPEYWLESRVPEYFSGFTFSGSSKRSYAAPRMQV
jgi:predicted alpha/beta-fold hydrolase